ncbi:hypothetical protein SMG44B_30380 [Stenotrophomonas maltophilia]|nr:hypothetical protein BN1263100095 [Stenotrophomonas maltophilia]
MRRGGVAIFCQGAMPLRPARAGRFSQGRRDGACGASSTGGGRGRRPGQRWSSSHMAGLRGGTGTIKTRPG